MTLKEARLLNNLTQKDAAALLTISLRSYKEYETSDLKADTLKYRFLLEELLKHNTIDEEHGILTLEMIKERVKKVLDKYDVYFCYLFGSYSRNEATELSDVDLLIDSDITGLKFFGLIEELRVELCKKVDLIKINQLDNNQELLRNILKDGLKIYE